MRAGDRVLVNESCVWKQRHGLLGTVVEADDDSAYVLLDEEGGSARMRRLFAGEPSEPWSAKFDISSLTVLS